MPLVYFWTLLLEDIAPRDGPQSAASMAAKMEASDPATKDVQASLEMANNLPPSNKMRPLLKVWFDRALELVGAPSYFFVPVFAQHVVSSSVVMFQNCNRNSRYGPSHQWRDSLSL